ncbi:hypothetical protein AAVH_08178 [Aphelenchoides avenae]|nr:hypothetical protein AAVH_08178 [Aphelenchus avenae]
MFQPKSLAAIAGAQLCNQDYDFKFCVTAIATEKAVQAFRQGRPFTNRLLPARGYAVMKRWAEDFKRVHVEGREPVYYLRWDLAKVYVDGHSNPAELLPHGYLWQFGPLSSSKRADDEINRTVRVVTEAWALLDFKSIPRREVGCPERRQVHGLGPKTTDACMWELRDYCWSK